MSPQAAEEAGTVAVGICSLYSGAARGKGRGLTTGACTWESAMAPRDDAVLGVLLLLGTTERIQVFSRGGLLYPRGSVFSSYV